MDKIKLEIIGISYSQSQTGAYALILGDSTGNKRLPIVIGGFEAQAIAIELEKMKPSRPLTHDLFRNFAMEFGILVTEVVIYRFADGIFYSRLVCEGIDKTCELDSRTSDAVALAVRFDCPIYTTPEVMAVAGIVVDENKEDADIEEDTEVSPTKEDTNELADYTLTELEELLAQAIAEEDYERASNIRDQIKLKKK